MKIQSYVRGLAAAALSALALGGCTAAPGGSGQVQGEEKAVLTGAP